MEASSHVARGAAQAVVDRLAQPFLRDRGHGDGRGRQGVGRPQKTEKTGRRLGQIAPVAKIEYGRSGEGGAKGEKGLAGARGKRVEAYRRGWRIVPGQAPGGAAGVDLRFRQGTDQRLDLSPSHGAGA